MTTGAPPAGGRVGGEPGPLRPSAPPTGSGEEEPAAPPVMRHGRLTGHVPTSGEDFHYVTHVGSARVEHIVSSASINSGSISAAPQQQELDEWVLVLAGSATLEASGVTVVLRERDWVFIPAGTPHRVLRAEEGTQWLAVHSGGPDNARSPGTAAAQSAP